MSVALNIGMRESVEEAEDLKGRYLVSLKLIERLHRLLLDVIKDEFDRLGRSDVNSVQALLLYNIGDAELTAGELTSRGYYLGSNVSYNLKKLVDAGYIDHQRSTIDRRSVRVKLTDKGQEICQVVNGALSAPAQVVAAGWRHRHRRSRDAEQGPDSPGALLDRPDSLPALIRKTKREL